MTCPFCEILKTLKKARAWSIVYDAQRDKERERDARRRKMYQSVAIDDEWKEAMSRRGADGLPMVDLTEWVLSQLRRCRKIDSGDA